MKKWEYKTFTFSVGISSDALDGFGSDGWELIAAIPLGWYERNTEAYKFIFKREKIEQVKPIEID